jgi:alanyl-tRNA synthetase
VLFAEIDGKPMVVIALTKLAQNLGAKAGALVKLASSVLGGGGGGKDDTAQGGGSDISKIDEAISAIRGELAK